MNVSKEHCQGKQAVLVVKICQLKGERNGKQQLLRFEVSGEIRHRWWEIYQTSPKAPSTKIAIWGRHPLSGQVISLSPAVSLLSQTPPHFLVQKAFVID